MQTVASLHLRAWLDLRKSGQSLRFAVWSFAVECGIPWPVCDYLDFHGWCPIEQAGTCEIIETIGDASHVVIEMDGQELRRRVALAICAAIRGDE